MQAIDHMNLSSDFRYLIVAIDKARDYVRHKPFKYEYGGSIESEWINLYPPMGPFRKELKRNKIYYQGKQLESYIRLYDTDIWMITEINLDILQSFMVGPFDSWDRETLQPFFLHTHREIFFDFDSIYTPPYRHNWSNTRPLVVYIEPKEDVEIDDITFLRLIEELKLKCKGHFEEKFQEFYSASPSAPGLFAAGARIFFHRTKGRQVDERLSKKDRPENDGLFLPDSVRHFIDYVNDIQELHHYYHKWYNFRFPEFQAIEPKNIHAKNIQYAEKLSLDCLLASQEFHTFSHKTERLLNESERHFENHKKYLDESADPTYVPINRATLRFMVLKDYEETIAMVKNLPNEHINTKLDRISNYVSNFFSVTSTKENIKLQKKVLYLSIVVFVLALITILFATLNSDTVIQRIIDSLTSDD